jgi:hypothetical protein
MRVEPTFVLLVGGALALCACLGPKGIAPPLPDDAEATGGAGGSGGSGGDSTGGAGGASTGGSGGASTGGSGGAAGRDAGARDATAGSGGTSPDASPYPDAAINDAAPGLDTRPDTRKVCGPVCAIYCQYGNVLDENGCPTCTCNPPPVCKPEDCPRPAPGAPNQMCSDGTIGGPVCEWAQEPGQPGRCAWIFRNCPDDCASVHEQPACDHMSACRWLVPGCLEPRLPAAGCYPRALINCNQDSCPAGKQCSKRSIDPCSGRLACPRCAVPVDICL